MNTTDYELPPLPDKDCPYGYSEVCLTEYARAALAPLLEDLAAHEASNCIKTENLETLREQNAKLREALIECCEMLNSTRLIMRERFDRGVAKAAVDRARAALGESDERKT